MRMVLQRVSASFLGYSYHTGRAVPYFRFMTRDTLVNSTVGATPGLMYMTALYSSFFPGERTIPSRFTVYFATVACLKLTALSDASEKTRSSRWAPRGNGTAGTSLTPIVV